VGQRDSPLALGSQPASRKGLVSEALATRLSRHRAAVRGALLLENGAQPTHLGTQLGVAPPLDRTLPLPDILSDGRLGLQRSRQGIPSWLHLRRRRLLLRLFLRLVVLAGGSGGGGVAAASVATCATTAPDAQSAAAAAAAAASEPPTALTAAAAVVAAAQSAAAQPTAAVPPPLAAAALAAAA